MRTHDGEEFGETAIRPIATDAQLIERCLQGEEEAWGRLLKRYGGLIYSVAYQCGLTHEDAGDVFQLVSVSLLEHLADLRQSASLPAWIATVARRHALHVANRNQRSTPSGSGADISDFQPDVEAEDMEELLATLRDQILVQEAMEMLPERCRQLLSMLFADDTQTSYNEIAEKLQMPIGSIGPTRARCLERLRRILEQLGF